jgi:hypothetical protein
MVLGVPEAPHPRRPRILLVDFEVARRGVEEQHVDFEGQEVRDGEEDGFLDGAVRVGVQQHVHRPVGLVFVHRLQARDRRVLRHPLGGRQL